MELKKTYTIWYAPGEPTGSLQCQDEWSDMSTIGWVKVGTHVVEVTIDLETASAVLGLVEKLEKAKKAVKAEAAVKANALDKHIATLLRLPYNPPADAAAPELKVAELAPENDNDIPF